MNNIINNYESDNKAIIIKGVSSLILCRVVISEQPTCVQKIEYGS